MIMTSPTVPSSFSLLIPSLLLLLLPLLPASLAYECSAPCEHGTCQESSYDPSYPDSSRGGYRCICDDGYGGPDCSVPYVACPDGTKCHNGSVCVRFRGVDASGGEEAEFRCDCSKAFGVSAYAGHECEMAATSVCEHGTPSSRYAFCTNGGRCVTTILSGEPHEGCECPDEFEGKHCQYLKGTAPPPEELDMLEDMIEELAEEEAEEEMVAFGEEDTEEKEPAAGDSEQDEKAARDAATARERGDVGGGGGADLSPAAVAFVVLACASVTVGIGWAVRRGVRDGEDLRRKAEVRAAVQREASEASTSGGDRMSFASESEATETEARLDVNPDGSSTMPRPSLGHDAFDDEDGGNEDDGLEII